MSETNIVLGELIVGKVVHRSALNCMVTSYENPDDWFMKQFFNQQELEDYARENKLAIKGEMHDVRPEST